ncbi:MAG: type 1 glutamine amidotransferase [Pikeienuella sp.]
MKIGVLIAGHIATALQAKYGQYDRSFAELLAPVDPEIEVISWDVVSGEMPSGPDQADGWIITGSKHGVYEDHPWIEPLKTFIRSCAAERSPLIGVCFGHQIMAEALGGKAEKSHKGWGLGPTDYATHDIPTWMGDTPPEITINAIHQDQVTKLPPDARRIASTDFCENAALLYGDAESPYAISIQPHPEFSDEYAHDLLQLRRGNAFPADLADAGLSRVGETMSNEWAAKWFVDFLMQSLPKR